MVYVRELDKGHNVVVVSADSTLNAHIIKEIGLTRLPTDHVTNKEINGRLSGSKTSDVALGLSIANSSSANTEG